MTEWLVNRFIKENEKIHDEKVRFQYGMLSSLTGITCNVILFVIKFVVGLITNSIAIISDGFNNLSDCMSCVISLVGYKISSKPADEKHPYGHGRVEYLISLVVAIIIFIVAFELFVASVKKIINPESVSINFVSGGLLIISILIKLWMSRFYQTLGNRIDSIAMKASAVDSKNDVIATSASLLGVILSTIIPKIPFDGIAGVFVSIYIALAGKDILFDILDRILGKPASLELTSQIQSKILSHKEILGVHDLILHDYGPGRMFGSAHAEVDSRSDFILAHDVIDVIEREIREQLNVVMTLHMDPIDLSDPITNQYREEITDLLLGMNSAISLHDFRRVPGETHTNLVFDILLPFGQNEVDVKQQIDSYLHQKYQGKTIAVITFDHSFTEEDRHEKNES